MLVAGWGTLSLHAEGDQVLQKTPKLTDPVRKTYALNIARFNLGTTMRCDRFKELSSDYEIGDGNIAKTPQPLISDDESICYKLDEGHTSIVLVMAKVYANNLFNFYNFKAAGTVSVSVSQEDLDYTSPKWRPVGSKVSFAEAGPVVVPFGLTEMRYIKIDFEITQTGEIAAFGLFGAMRNMGYRSRPSEEPAPLPLHEIINYSYADLYTALAAVPYVSSCDKGNSLKDSTKMIDNNSDTKYDFAAEDPSPTLVADLGSKSQVRRITSVQVTPPGRMDYYVMGGLPGAKTKDSSTTDFRKGTRGLFAANGWLPFLLAFQNQGSEDGPPVLDIPPSFYAVNKPFRSFELPGGKSRVAFDFDISPVRYLLMRFTPKNGPGPLSIVEINAFGNTRRQVFEPAWPLPEGLTDATRQSLIVPPNPPDPPPVSH